jgi:hypothetical protein
MVRRVTRALPLAVFAVAIGLTVAGCSSGQSIQATISNGATQASVSGVRCAPGDRDVIVTGTLTAHASTAEPAVRATVYNSHGNRIGELNSGKALNAGESQPFRLTVAINGFPARCVVGGTVVGDSVRPRILD